VFLNKPMEQPFVPHWNRVVSAMPNIYQRLIEAVERDRELYSR
ncbi:glycosyl transferase, partial [bacterium]|nr:glycosyl transferase [bacterium]